MKFQVLTIALVIASGIVALISYLSTYDSLKRAQSRYYQEARFAHIFSNLKRAPQSLEKRLSQIPGVVTLETRLVQDYLLHFPDRVESAVGRFISLPPQGQLRLNQLYLRQGRMPDPTRSDEVLVNESFAEANHFKPGSFIAAVINGKYQKFKIVGTVFSPEYIFAIRGATPIPDNRQFGIFWLNQKALEAAMDMEGSFNSLTLTLGPKSLAPEVIDRVDEYLRPYGGLGAYGRKDQVSHRYLTDDINQAKVMAVVIPIIFMAVAAYILNVVLGRRVALQRTQIATLKAMGYTNFSIALHYFKLVTLILALGFILGCGIGIWLGIRLTQLYMDFYHFPFQAYYLNPAICLLALGVSFFSALLGVYGALRQIFKLQPAEAMRPPAPPAFHKNIWERWGVTRLLSSTGKIIFRNLAIRPWRSTLAVFGVSFAMMITIMGLLWWDIINYIVYAQFQVTQREDAMVTLVDPRPHRTLYELEHYPGVLSVEGYRLLPVRLRLGHRHAQSGLMGLPRNARLRLLVNEDLETVALPAEGLMLSQLLAKRLRAEPGDPLEVEVLEGKRQKWQLPVGGIVDQWVGFAAYMDQSQLSNLLDEDRINLASLQVDPKEKTRLQLKLKNLPAVAGIHFKDYLQSMFRKTIVNFLLIFASILTVFALIIAMGVVYNSARVSLSERAWELMSLRVLGFTRHEVFKIIGGEISFQILCALPLGALLGYAFSAWMVKLMQTDTFDLPLIVKPHTFAFASLVVVISGIFSILIIRRHLNRMNLVSALKVRE